MVQVFRSPENGFVRSQQQLDAGFTFQRLLHFPVEPPASTSFTDKKSLLSLFVVLLI
jgi:hypothetical protein